ncbi:MAG TPA: SMC family ATPase, partial [candidate division Zixibacteria bacterium]|nr:SMC family ATPase [candidate division Zixibacteria bacterium]
HNIERMLEDCRTEIFKREGQLDGRDVIALADEVARIDNALATEEELKAELETARRSWEAENSRKIAIDAEIAQLDARTSEESEKLALLGGDSEGNCPLCGQSLDDAHRDMVRADIESAIEVARERVVALREELDDKTRALDEIEKRGKELREKARELDGLNKLRAEKASELEKAEALLKEIAELKAREAELSRKLAEDDYLPEERKRLAELKAEFAEKAPPEKLIEASSEKLESLRESEFLFQQIPELKKQRKALEAELDEHKAALKNKRQALESKGDVAGNIAEIERWEAAIAEAGYDKAEHERLKAQAKKLKELTARLHEIEKAESTAGEIEKAITSGEERLTAIDKKKATLCEKIRALREMLPDIAAFSSELSQAREAVASLDSERTSALNELAKAKLNIDALKAHKESLSDVRGKLAKIEGEMRIHRLLAEAMGKDGVPAFVISHALPEIEREADELLALISGAEMAVRLAPEGQSGDFRLRISDADGERAYESFSGGESFRVDFALRLALSRFLAQRSGAELSLLIIDEGFGTQDAEGLALLTEALRSVEHEFSLILVVTHLESMKEEFEQIIEVSKTSGGTSKIAVFA